VDRIYLDHNATTPLDPRVVEAMAAVMSGGPGNPSSLHWFGQRARATIEEARGQVAKLIGAASSEVVFTAGGTEADNTAIRGLAMAAHASRRKLVVSAIEHHAVIGAANTLAKEAGFEVDLVRARSDGIVDVNDLAARIDDRTAVVALMLANNETGTIQPVAEAARIAHERGAAFHCDAVQGAGKVPIDVRALGADTLAISAHKLYGPQGVGALFVRRGTAMRALLHGGSQERNRRAGTENVAGIAGFGLAAAIADAEREPEAVRLENLRDLLETRLLALPGALRNGDGPRVPNTTNISFEGTEAESLVMALDLMGIAASSGAACTAGAVEPSHVLRGMGLPLARVGGSLRFSLGRGTTEAAISRAADAVAEAVERQRSRSIVHA
jgi:cysteine desulfurase